MKRFAPLFLLLAASFAAAPVQAATSQHPVNTIVVDRFTNANGMALSPNFVQYFADDVSEELAKDKVAAQVVDEGTPVPGAAAQDSVVIEGRFLSHEDAGLIKPGRLTMEVSIYRLSDHALIQTMTPATKFPFNGDKKERAYAYYTGFAAADTVAEALRSMDVSGATPLTPAASSAVTGLAALNPAALGPLQTSVGPNVTTPSAAPAAAPAPPADGAASTGSDAFASVQLSSSPSGADITIDDNYVGNTPTLIKLKPGTHSIKMTLPGYAPWERSIETAAGESRNFAATLEKSSQ
jgi:hypothetical protein